MAKQKTPAAFDTKITEPSSGSKKKYADDDNSIDARMWRLEQDHVRMGARPK